MNNAKRISALYLKKVKQAACPYCLSKQEAFSQLNSSIAQYTLEHPDLCYNDLVVSFGQPEEIAELAFCEELPRSSKKYLCFSKKRIVFDAALIAVLIILIFMGIVMTQSNEAMSHYFEETNTEQLYQNP